MLWLWILWIVCVVATVGLWFGMNKVALNYEEVEVRVLSAVTKRVKNKKNGSTYDFYEIKVDYNGTTYDLENAHDSYSYTQGKKIKAYLYKNKLYANVEGVKTATPTANLYFIFLFGSIGLLCFNLYYSGKLKENKKKATIKEESIQEDKQTEEVIEEKVVEDKKEPKTKNTTKKSSKKTTKKSK